MAPYLNQENFLVSVNSSPRVALTIAQGGFFAGLQSEPHLRFAESARNPIACAAITLHQCAPYAAPHSIVRLSNRVSLRAQNFAVTPAEPMPSQGVMPACSRVGVAVNQSAAPMAVPTPPTIKPTVL
jgi:hypothetical protein